MVKINSRYMVKADGNCFMVCDILTYPEGSKSGKAGEHYYRPFAYCTTFKQALECVFKALCRDVVSGGEILTVQQAIADMRRVEAEVQAIFDQEAEGL